MISDIVISVMNDFKYIGLIYLTTEHTPFVEEMLPTASGLHTVS